MALSPQYSRTSIVLSRMLLERARRNARLHSATLSRLLEFVIARGVDELEANPRLGSKLPPERRDTSIARAAIGRKRK